MLKADLKFLKVDFKVLKVAVWMHPKESIDV